MALSGKVIDFVGCTCRTNRIRLVESVISP
jgi:hypothetical protein